VNSKIVKNALFIFLVGWFFVYSMLCVTYVSILNPIQWVLDFESYSEDKRICSIFITAPLVISLCLTQGFTHKEFFNKFFAKIDIYINKETNGVTKDER